MTVKELIELLQKCPDQNMRVVIDGYEGGYHDVDAEQVGGINLKLNHYKEWYYGPHESVDVGEKGDEIALIIGRSTYNKLPLW